MRIFGYLLLTAWAVTAAPRPNVVFVITDDMGWGDVGFNGQQRFQTPNIDRLASEGAILDNFYAASPVCGPSRASLITGRHQGSCKIRGNPGWNKSRTTIDLDDGDMSLAKELKRAGYATACLGKWGLNEQVKVGTGHPLRHGFDEFWGYNTHVEAHYHWAPHVWHNHTKVDWGGQSNWHEKKIYGPDFFTDKALEFIDAQAGKQPFFLYLAYTITHLGITVPADSRAPFEKLDWPKEPGKTSHYRNDPEKNAAYAGMMTRLDGYMGRLAERLQARGIADNTMIFFTSDNGPHFDRKDFFNSNGDFSGYKRSVREGGLRMPAFVRWPKGIKQNSRLADVWAFWDVLPTLCDAAGIEPSQHTDGKSFLPALTGQPQSQHEYLYWEFNEGQGPMQAARFGKWKVIRLWNDKAARMGPIALFDLDADPGERNNVASQHPELVDRAQRYLAAARTDDPEYPLVHLRPKGKSK